MNIPVYVKPQERLVGYKITKENIAFVAAWCNGNLVKRKIFPVFIQFWSDGFFYEAYIDNWVIRLPTERHFIVLSDRCFTSNFMVDE